MKIIVITFLMSCVIIAAEPPARPTESSVTISLLRSEVDRLSKVVASLQGQLEEIRTGTKAVNDQQSMFRQLTLLCAEKKLIVSSNPDGSLKIKDDGSYGCEAQKEPPKK